MYIKHEIHTHIYILIIYIYVYIHDDYIYIYIRMPSNCLKFSFNRMSAVVAWLSGESVEFGKRTCRNLRRWHRCTSTLLVLQRDLVWQLSCVSDLISITWIPFHKYQSGAWCSKNGFLPPPAPVFSGPTKPQHRTMPGPQRKHGMWNELRDRVRVELSMDLPSR